jgi:hypothetical protein
MDIETQYFPLILAGMGIYLPLAALIALSGFGD